jgi:hypothetical protein
MSSSEQEQNNFQKKRIKALVDVLVRQSDMSEEEAELNLKNNNYDLMKTLREYMQNSNTTEENKKIETNKSKTKTINQMIYSEIRNTMDNASLNFLRKQEYQRNLENIRNRMLYQTRQNYENQRENLKENSLIQENNMNKLD